MKDFKLEIVKMYDGLQSRQNFAFSKYADGEWAAMTGRLLNNGEFSTQDDHDTKVSIELLIRSFQYKDEGYFVGISCPCCQGPAHDQMKQASGQDECNLTYANLFVNSNYSFYENNFIPEYKNWKVNLVAHEDSNIGNLPFEVSNFFPIKKNAWIENVSLIEELKKLQTENELYLFCAGPFGNILSHNLWSNNKNNTYLDIGSTLNPYLETEGFKRGYLYGSDDVNKVCNWGS